MTGPEHNNARPKALALIPAAGAGRRMNSGAAKKTWLPLLDKPMLAHTLEQFERAGCIDAVIVMVAPDDVEMCRAEVIKRYGLQKVISVVAGGESRQDSVSCGLKAMTDAGGEYDVIAVHDGARPLVTTDVIERTVTGAWEHGSAIAAMPAKDTIKVIETGLVVSTPPRERLYVVQTPQAFRTEILRAAHAHAAEGGFAGTDESSLVERLGAGVVVVEGSYENIKVTTPEDMVVAEAILSARARA